MTAVMRLAEAVLHAWIMMSSSISEVLGLAAAPVGVGETHEVLMM